jgi:DNA-binding MarR family transcriptional regulator
MTSRAAGTAGAGPVDAVLAASRALVGVAASSISVLGDEVTLPQFRALVLVSDGRATAPGDLAVALGVHPSNATRVIDRMVAKGLLERMPAPDDRRAVTLALGPEGRSALRRVTARRQAEIESVLGAMAPDRAALVAEVLGEFAAAAGEAADEAWRLGWGT